MAASCVTEWAAQNQAANELFSQGRFEEALAHYESLRARYPMAEISYNAGTTLAGLGRDSDAAWRLESSLEGASPAVQAAAHYNRGFVLFRLGDCARAREAFAAALAINAADEDARFNLGAVERELARGPGGACLGERVAGAQASSSEEGGEEMPGGEPGADAEQGDQPGLSEPMRDLLTRLQQGSGNRATELQTDHPNMSIEEALQLLEEVRGRLGGFEAVLHGATGVVQP
jgi:tetratricopeptide (TPR) repeat protein